MHYLSFGESVPATAVADVFGQLLHNHDQNPLKSGQADEDDKLKDSHQQRRTLAETDQHMIISYQHIKQTHLQVSPVAAKDLDTAYRVSGAYLPMSVPSVLSDIRAQTRQQRIHQKPGFQFITVVGVAHDMAQIRQLGINHPRVRPEKRQKKNRKDGNITPIMVMDLVLLHPPQPVVCIANSLEKLRDNQNQKVLIIPEFSI